MENDNKMERAGNVDDLPKPVTREEIYLDFIARNGGGGGGGIPEAPKDGKAYARRNAEWVRNIDSGNALPASGYDGQFFVLLEDSGSNLKGLYCYNGTAWKKTEAEAVLGNAYESLEPVGNIDSTYLAKVNYVSLDYGFARKFLDGYATGAAACASVVRNGVLVRNYDWKYSNACEFVVRTPAINGRHAVIGMVGQVRGLTKDFVKGGGYSGLYKVLPFMLADGKNDAGLKVSVNIVPNDKGDTTGTLAGAEVINALMLTRWALDYCSSVGEVVEATRSKISVAVPQTLRDMGYEVHFMVSDNAETKVLEFVNNTCVWINHDRMTNFFIDGVAFKSDGSVPVVGDIDIGGYGLTEHSAGLERYNVIVNGETIALPQLAEKLKYTKTYTLETDIWYSELCGGDLEITSPAADFESAMAVERAKYSERSRDTENTWQTVHSVIYDDESMRVWTQEGYAAPYVFALPKEAGCLDKTYKHSQVVPSDEWEVVHNLGRFPSVTVVDSAGTVVDGQVTYASDIKVVIKFNGSFAGTAYLN